MSTFVRRLQTTCALILTAALALAGCAGSGAAPAPANIAAAKLDMAAPAPAPAGAEEFLDYLKAAQGDFAIIDKILADQDLGLLEEPDASTDEEALTVEQSNKYIELLNGYDAQIKDTLNAIGERSTPADDDIAAFKASETAQMQLAMDLIEEYIQILRYYNSFISMYDTIGNVTTNTDASDLEGLYKAYNEAITAAIDLLKGTEIPSFWKSMNDSMIAALTEMNDSVLYYLSAISLNDPLRMDAAMYRWNMLLRRFDSIGTAYVQDLTDRQTKLVSDAKGMQQACEGLKQWLKDNIDKLEQ